MPVANNVYAATAAFVAASGQRSLVVRLPSVTNADLLALHVALRRITGHAAEWFVSPGLLEDGTPGARCVKTDRQYGLLSTSYIAMEALDVLEKNLAFSTNLVNAYDASMETCRVEYPVQSRTGSWQEDPATVAHVIDAPVRQLASQINARQPSRFHVLNLMAGSVRCANATRNGKSLRFTCVYDVARDVDLCVFDVGVSG